MNKIKFFLILIVSFYSCILFAQKRVLKVGSNPATINSSAVLEIESTNKGFLPPRMTQAQRLAIASPTAGLMVYQTNLTKGYYYYDGSAWTSFIKQEASFDDSSLGYTTGSYWDVANLTGQLAPGGATITELGTNINPDNGHYYLAISLSAGITFSNAYLLAKQYGGYLVTMTSDAEREWVNTNIVANGTGFNLTNAIWIGYAKVTTPGNANEFRWITNEQFSINWGISPTSATVQHWFNTGEPNNSSGTEGYCHVLNTASSATRKWNDLTGSTTAGFTNLIIEFNR